MSSSLDGLLREASALVGCEDVSIRCWHALLEVVYVERREGDLVVTDRGETYQYLSRGDDSTYDMSLLDDDSVREICGKHGVELDTSDPELFPRIERHLSPDDDAASAVTAVAQAIDRVMAEAMRPELRG